ncbi:LysM peptidoglycan-binding domain-containing protein [Brachybacterium sp. EF45031]|uniref:LysM peptidoglycan-binding domain-containing protein n=1 Tax=Brachybacterium sillae TaxID=2810536 RepID=UPI00217D7DB3|nr:LysM peptidoglycan-binding domain-containing protein [Brachybacterium sillae]MCS6712385.1 LysM peptidoglycan-binding domain-containing protein [Brachybacterium sillae]
MSTLAAQPAIVPALRGGRGPAAPTHLVPTRRARLLMTLPAVAAMVLAIAALVLGVGPGAAIAGGGADTLVVQVEAGDTLWAYAEEYAPEGMTASQFVHEVQQLNNLPTARLTAGQTLELPVAEDAGH